MSGCPVDARKKSERGQAGNAVGFMNVTLRTDIANPKQRLEAVHKEARQAKAYAFAVGRRVALDVTDTLPVGLVNGLLDGITRCGLLSSTAPVTNTIVNNVPGLPQLRFSLHLKRFAAAPQLTLDLTR